MKSEPFLVKTFEKWSIYSQNHWKKQIISSQNQTKLNWKDFIITRVYAQREKSQKIYKK